MLSIESSDTPVEKYTSIRTSDLNYLYWILDLYGLSYMYKMVPFGCFISLFKIVFKISSSSLLSVCILPLFCQMVLKSWVWGECPENLRDILPVGWGGWCWGRGWHSWCWPGAGWCCWRWSWRCAPHSGQQWSQSWGAETGTEQRERLRLDTLGWSSQHSSCMKPTWFSVPWSCTL